MPIVPMKRLRRQVSGHETLERLLRWPALRRNLLEGGVLIYSAEHGYYWRKGGHGYGGRREAGLFSIDEALGLTRHCGPEKKIEFHSLF